MFLYLLPFPYLFLKMKKAITYIIFFIFLTQSFPYLIKHTFA